MRLKPAILPRNMEFPADLSPSLDDATPGTCAIKDTLRDLASFKMLPSRQDIAIALSL